MKNVFQKTVLAFLFIAALFCMLTGMPPKIQRWKTIKNRRVH